MPVLIGKESFESQISTAGEFKKDKIKILFLDNSEPDFELVVRHLTNKGLEFIAKRCNTLNSFKSEVTQLNPDIVLADYNQNGFSAIDALNYLKQIGSDIPFIILTVSQPEEIIINSFKAGIDDYISKSNPEPLLNAINTLIKEKKIKQENGKNAAFFKLYAEIGENYLLTQSLVNTGFLILNSSTKKILFANNAFCTISGYNINDIFKLHSFLTLIEEEYVKVFNANLNALIKNKNAVRIFRLTLKKKNDEKISVEITAKQIIKNILTYPGSTENDPESDNIQVQFIVRELTEKINRELMQSLTNEALLEREKRFRSFIEEAKDYAIIMLDIEGRITNWNNGAKKITGFTENEIILKEFNTILQNENNKGNNSNYLLLQAQKERHAEKELWLKKKDGSRFWALVSVTVLFNGGTEPLNYSVIIKDLTENKIKEDHLKEHEKQLRALAAHLQAAREEERTRIARELHDEFSQMLTAVRLDLTILSRMVAKTVAEPLNRLSLLEKISSISDLLETTIKSIRRIITQLRPTVLDELGLLTAIQWQAQEFENRTHIRCRITKLQHNINPDQNVSTAIFRIYQEALTNVARHASATVVNLSLQKIKNDIVMEISDNGKGIDNTKLKDPTSTGIMGIRERITALGGRFEIISEINKGTKLIIYIPYNNV